jgi:hypothetical protein
VRCRDAASIITVDLPNAIAQRVASWKNGVSNIIVSGERDQRGWRGNFRDDGLLCTSGKPRQHMELKKKIGQQFNDGHLSESVVYPPPPARELKKKVTSAKPPWSLRGALYSYFGIQFNICVGETRSCK